MRLFNGDVLVVRDVTGAVVAGPDSSSMTPCAHELAVGTQPLWRGGGLARQLLAQMAPRILAEGAVPTYLQESERRSARAARAVRQATDQDDRGAVTRSFEQAAPRNRYQPRSGTLVRSRRSQYRKIVATRQPHTADVNGVLTFEVGQLGHDRFSRLTFLRPEL